MGFILLDRNSTVATTWSPPSDKGGTISTSFDDKMYLMDPAFFSDNASPFLWHGRGNNRLSYDPATDELILTNGEMRFVPRETLGLTWPNGDPLQTFRTWVTGANWESAKDSMWTHTRYDANSLDPIQALIVNGYSQFEIFHSGENVGFTYDHNKGILYGYLGTRVAVQTRASGEFNRDLGNARLLSLTNPTPFVAGSTKYTIEYIGEDILPTAEQKRLILKLSQGLAASFPYPVKPAQEKFMVSPVLFDDVAVFVYSGGSHYGGALWVIRRDGSGTWLSSRPVDQAWFFAMFPIGIDRFMTIGYIGVTGFKATRNDNFPLVAMTWRYNRTDTKVELDDIAEVPTKYSYDFPQHTGYMAFDTKRQALILMSPNMESFERHVFDILCHPISPGANGLQAVSPVEPVHAGQRVRFAAATTKDTMPVNTPKTDILYTGSVGATNFDYKAQEFRTGGDRGTGFFDVGFTSAALSAGLTIQIAMSGWSALLSSTTAYGEKFGVSPVSLLSVSASFLVSATLSAASPTTVGASTNILAKKPIKVNDAGGGTPRELDHPSSGSFPSPLVYELNPQVWTGQLDQALEKPLYATARTLEKTATVQYTKDITDIVVAERWMGGGKRVAMGLSFFTSLYDYFNNPPDLRLEQFILWRPRDVSEKVYKVVLTGLTVGGEEHLQFDRLVAQGDGWIHDEVILTMKIIEEVT